MKRSRLLINFVPLILLLLSIAFLFFRVFFYASLGLGALLIVLTVKYLVEKNSSRPWLPFIFSPLLVFLGGELYAVFLSSYLYLSIIFLVIIWFVYSYLRNLYYYLAYGAPERERKIDNLLLTGGFISVWALAGSLFNIQAFLNWPFWLFLLFFVPFAWISFANFSWWQKNFSTADLVVLFNTIILLELAWILSLLPLNYNILGFLLALFYYFLLFSLRLSWRRELNRRRLRLVLIGSLVVIFLILLTATWL